MIDLNKVVPLFKLNDGYNGSKIITTRDNNGQYRKSKPHKGNNFGVVYTSDPIRVPSLKRNKRVWKNFYKLFPQLEGLNTYLGIKLKKL